MQRIRITKAPRRQRVAADLGDNLGALPCARCGSCLACPAPASADGSVAFGELTLPPAWPARSRRRETPGRVTRRPWQGTDPQTLRDVPCREGAGRLLRTGSRYPMLRCSAGIAGRWTAEEDGRCRWSRSI
jgi:hypothetical protein